MTQRTAARCDLTELFVDECAHCRPPADPAADFLNAPQTEMGPWFPASYPGDCNECGCRFEQRDMIRADGEGGWAADCCGEAGS